MEKNQNLSHSIDTLAWAAFFIWWGVTELVSTLPAGVGAIGLGIILLGLNLVRYSQGIPASGFTTVLGILALVLGGLELATVVFNLAYELPIFAILLVTLGVLLLGGEILRMSRQQ